MFTIRSLYAGAGLALLAALGVAGPGRSRPPAPAPAAVAAGPASFTAPRWLAEHARAARPGGGQVVLGEMDERELCFEHFLGFYWSREAIPDEALVPAPAYHRVPRPRGAAAGGPDPEGVPLTHLYFRAVKPCGRVVEAELVIHRGTCPGTGAHFAVTAILDPLLGPGQVAAVVRSLRCS